MKTSRTALAAAAFGVAAMIAPASAEEIKYNFTSEFGKVSVAADSRTEGGNTFVADDVQARTGPVVSERRGWGARPSRSHTWRSYVPRRTRIQGIR